MLALSAGCGKKGPPQPPLRPVPVAVSEFSAEKWGPTVFLRFVVPSANLDGTKPPGVDRVELYGTTLPASAPPPSGAQVVQDGRPIGTASVARSDDATQPPGTAARPGPGDRAELQDVPAVTAGVEPSVRYYAAVPMAGRRRGPVSPVLAVSLADPPPAPTGLAGGYDERTLTLTWNEIPGRQYFVERVTGDAAAVLTPEPLAESSFRQATEFGVERCHTVRAVEVSGSVRIVGAMSERVCVTPIDRFPPDPPTGLLAAATDAGVELVWTASTATDVAGYVVLRADGANGTLQRLTPTPVTDIQYRDRTARPGTTYSYAIVAVDKAAPPNESAPGGRQVVTARRPAP